MKKSNLFKYLLCISAVLLLQLGVYAQWSPDSTLNLGVAVETGDQQLPKITATPDGGCYISWFDNRSGAYCMYLQRLNSLGEAQFAPNGMLVSSYPQMTWLVDYDMTTDQNNNAVIVFSDMRNGTGNDLDVVAYKIASDGSFIWGTDGIVLSDSVNTDFEPAPKVTATSEGNFVFAWEKSNTDYRITFQKLSSGGQKMWGPSGIVYSPTSGERLHAPDVAAADNDGAVAFWKYSTGPAWAPTTWLYAQKFDSSGTELWGAGGVLFYNLGQITAWTYPRIYSDAAGGAFITYYDSPPGNFNVWVQHINSAGSLIFPLNGVQASTNSSDRLHMNPDLAYVPSTEELYVFWVESNGGQSQFGVYGQKISPAGNRLWSDSGREFAPLTGSQTSFVCCGAAGTSVYVGYFESPTTVNTAVKAFRIDSSGNMLWGGSRILSVSGLGSKDDLGLTVNSENRAFFAWADTRSGGYDIYAQNVNLDGSLGNPAAPALTVTLIRNSPPTIPPINFDASIHNSGASAVNFDAWTVARLPNGAIYGPIILRTGLTINPGQTIMRIVTQNVPGSAPAGNYYYIGNVGTFPNTVVAADSFIFTKLAGEGAPVNNSGWAVSGWFGDEELTILNSQFSILYSSPNPFNASTVASFELRDASQIRLAIYDIAGREVAVLAEGYYPAGTHQAVWNASSMPSGVYFARLEAGNFQQTRKMLLVK